MLAHLRQTALGVTHGSSRISIDRAEVALSVNQRIAHVPLLSHAYEGSIYRTVTMGMILSKNFAHHACTFLVWFVTAVADTHHSV